MIGSDLNDIWDRVLFIGYIYYFTPRDGNRYVSFVFGVVIPKIRRVGLSVS